jgi:hypothetical protein
MNALAVAHLVCGGRRIDEELRGWHLFIAKYH